MQMFGEFSTISSEHKVKSFICIISYTTNVELYSFHTGLVFSFGMSKLFNDDAGVCIVYWGEDRCRGSDASRDVCIKFDVKSQRVVSCFLVKK